LPAVCYGGHNSYMKLLTCDDDQLPRSWAPLLQKLIKTYLVLSIPIVAIFVFSPATRFAAWQALARSGTWAIPISRVFCGDEITRDGGAWGWRINANPFGTLNIADGNVTSWQVLEQVRAALEYRPKTVYVTAGRFDVDDPAYDESRTLENIRKILQLANDEGAHLVLTLAPYGTSPEKNALLASLNARIEEQLENASVINMNNTIAPQGTLLHRYTNDGVHLNAAAYDVWAGMVKSAMAGGDSFRPTNSASQPPRVKRR
jgi:lysophospholipase L1-like esterase